MHVRSNPAKIGVWQRYLNSRKTKALQKLLLSPLFLASEAMKLVAAGADPNAADGHGDTLLHKLVVNDDNHLLIEELVSKYRADVNQQNASERTPLQRLIHSSSQFNIKNAMMLLTLGADKNSRNNEGESVLHRVVVANVENTTAVIERLVTEFKMDIDVRIDHSTETPLFFLIADEPYAGKLNLVKWLVAKGAKLRATDIFQDNALHYAARCGDIEVAQWLIEQQRLNIHASGRVGATPLYVACFHGHLEMAKFLVASGANLKDKNADNRTLLHAAFLSGSIDTALWLLQSRQIDFTAKDKFGDTALNVAILSAAEVSRLQNAEAMQQSKETQQAKITLRTTAVADAAVALFKKKHDLSLEHSGIFSSIKKWWSKLREIFAAAAKLMKPVTMAEVKAHAAANPSSRTAHILKVMNSKMTAADFKKEYEAARKKQWFHNPFETTMRDRLAALTRPEDLDMATVQDHAIKRPESLTAQILTLSLKP